MLYKFCHLLTYVYIMTAWLLWSVDEQFWRELVWQRQHAASLVRSTSCRRQDGCSSQLSASVSLGPRVSVQQRTVLWHGHLRRQWPRSAVSTAQRPRIHRQRDRIFCYHRSVASAASQHGTLIVFWNSFKSNQLVLKASFQDNPDAPIPALSRNQSFSY